MKKFLRFLFQLVQIVLFQIYKKKQPRHKQMLKFVMLFCYIIIAICNVTNVQDKIKRIKGKFLKNFNF